MRLRDVLTAAGVPAATLAEWEAPEGAAAGLPERVPWINRVVAVAGSWFSSCFFCGSLGMCFGQVFSLDDSFGIVAGFFLMIAATAVYRLFGESRAGLFVKQLALSWMLAGQVMFYLILGDEFSKIAAGVAAMILAPILMVAFPDTVQRFVAAGGALLGLVVVLNELDLPVANVAGLAALGMMLLAWLPPERSLDARLSGMRTPLLWAGIVGLCSINVFYWKNGWLFDGPDIATGPGGLSVWIVLPAALGFLIGLLERQGALRSELGATLVAALAGIALLTQGRPGVLLGLIGVMLGWDRRDRALTVLGFCYLGWFGVQYYYDLTLDLWTKGLVLIGSGLLLLALRGWLKFRKFLDTDSVSGAIPAGEAA